MRALRYARYGPPEVLEVVDLPAPAPGPGELLVRVGAASLNPLDWKIRSGHLRFLPVAERPPRGVGRGYALVGHHELMIPLLAAALVEGSAGSW